MTYKGVRELLRQVKYKPGWTLTTSSGPDDYPLIVRVRFEAPNCEDPSQTISLGIPRQLEYTDLDYDGFVEWLIETIRRCEDHEMREWLRVGRQKVDDPHADPEALERLTYS